MKYISGIHALNLPCSLDTMGDWHKCSLNWNNIKMYDSNDSIYKEYGIETCDCVPFNPGIFYIANTLRAILDLVENRRLDLAGGAEVFISNPKYEKEFFDKVCELRSRDDWNEIDRFMGKEYLSVWLDYKEKNNV